jgi:hypothetical protein
MSLVLADRNHPDRDRLERAVRDVFQAEFNAYVPGFPKHLIAALGPNREPRAVAGLRFAEDGLFSEVYLDGSIEEVLPPVFGRPVSRTQVVEFSSLAAPTPGAALPLMIAAIRIALAAGASFGLFTATDRLHALLARTGLGFVDLGPARPERMANAAIWGDYYRHDPHVLAIAAESLPAAFAIATRSAQVAHA